VPYLDVVQSVDTEDHLLPFEALVELVQTLLHRSSDQGALELGYVNAHWKYTHYTRHNTHIRGYHECLAGKSEATKEPHLALAGLCR
jgi:hypothetical protein